MHRTAPLFCRYGVAENPYLWNLANNGLAYFVHTPWDATTLLTQCYKGSIESPTLHLMVPGVPQNTKPSINGLSVVVKPPLPSRIKCIDDSPYASVASGMSEESAGQEIMALFNGIVTRYISVQPTGLPIRVSYNRVMVDAYKASDILGFMVNWPTPFETTFENLLKPKFWERPTSDDQVIACYRLISAILIGSALQRELTDVVLQDQKDRPIIRRDPVSGELKESFSPTSDQVRRLHDAALFPRIQLGGYGYYELDRQVKWVNATEPGVATPEKQLFRMVGPFVHSCQQQAAAAHQAIKDSFTK